MATNLAGLQTLLRLQSPSNMRPADPYVAKRQAQIIGGEDALAPSELDQMKTQLQLGDQGLGVSRDMIRDSGISTLRQKLGLAKAEEDAKTADALAVAGQQGKNALSVANANNAALAPGRAAEAGQVGEQTNLLRRAADMFNGGENASGGTAPAGGRMKTSINGKGEVSFTEPTQIESAQDRLRVARQESAGGFLDRLNTLREKINTKMGPQAGISGTIRRGYARMGMDPDVAEYERERMAGGRALAVAVMGAQNLSDADAKAWADMLPGATTDKETARRLMEQVGRMLNKTPTGPDANADVNVDQDPRLQGLF